MAPGVAEAFPVLYLTQLSREMYSQPIVHKALSWGTIRKAACILAAITIRKSQLYALIRHDCIAALTATGLDPFVGYLHAERPNRPALGLI